MQRMIFWVLLAIIGAAYSIHAQEPGKSADKTAEKPKYIPKDRITSSEYKLSNSRVEQIHAVIQKYYDRRADLESSDTLSSIKSEIQNFVPLTPAEKPDMRSLFAIKDSLASRVNQKYGKSQEEIKKEAAAEAAKKFPMAKRNEEVKLYYQRGRSTLSLKGHFYGFGYGGKSVKLDSRNIPVFDLLPESKALFDKNANAELRKIFVEEKLQEYNRAKLNYSEQLFRKEYTGIRAKNEKLGYIYQNNNWETAETVMKIHLEEMIKKAKLREEKERLEKEAREKARRDAGGAPNDAQKKNNDAEEDDE